MRRWQRAKASVALARFRDPCCLRLTARPRRRSFRRLRSSARGLWIEVPSEQTANVWMPRSTPTTGPSTEPGSGRATSTVNEQYQRSASRRQVADRIRPRNLPVASLVVTRPILGSITAPSSTRIVPVSRNRSGQRPRFLKRGKPTRRPCFRPRQLVGVGPVEIAQRLLWGALGHLVQPGEPGGTLEPVEQPVKVDGSQRLAAPVI